MLSDENTFAVDVWVCNPTNQELLSHKVIHMLRYVSIFMRPSNPANQIHFPAEFYSNPDQTHQARVTVHTFNTDLTQIHTFKQK